MKFELLSLLLAASASAAPAFHQAGLQVTPIRFPLNKAVAPSLRKRQSVASDPLGDLGDYRYDINITIGGQTLPVILDSGSASTYAYAVQPTGDPTSRPLFDYTAEGVYETSVTYSAQYGGSSEASQTTTSGIAVLTDLKLSPTNLTLTNFTVAALTSASSGVGASGLLGLGFPLPNSANYQFAFEAAYVRENQAKPTQAYLEKYVWPVVPALYAQNLIPANVFSLYLNREGYQVQDQDITPGNGSLTLGGYPNNLQQSDFTWTGVPVSNLQSPDILAQLGGDLTDFGYPQYAAVSWTALVEAIFLNGNQLTPSKLLPNGSTEDNAQWAAIDSGTPTMILPTDVVSQITTAWASNPQNATIPCNTQLKLEFQFNGTRFAVSNEDLIVPYNQAIDSIGAGGYATSACQVQLQPLDPLSDSIGVNTSTALLLGDTFMRNVVTAFDYGDLWNAQTTPPRIGFKALI